jgi:hypothetical protein
MRWSAATFGVKLASLPPSLLGGTMGETPAVIAVALSAGKSSSRLAARGAELAPPIVLRRQRAMSACRKPGWEPRREEAAPLASTAVGEGEEEVQL